MTSSVCYRSLQFHFWKENTSRVTPTLKKLHLDAHIPVFTSPVTLMQCYTQEPKPLQYSCRGWDEQDAAPSTGTARTRGTVTAPYHLCHLGEQQCKCSGNFAYIPSWQNWALYRSRDFRSTLNLPPASGAGSFSQGTGSGEFQAFNCRPKSNDSHR